MDQNQASKPAYIDDGGPAFPFPGWKHPNSCDGDLPPLVGAVTLLDYFAAHALIGVMTTTSVPDKEQARRAYRVAAEMLNAKATLVDVLA